MLALPYVQVEAVKGDMLRYERFVHNEKLQQDVDLERRDGLLCPFQGAATDAGFFIIQRW